MDLRKIILISVSIFSLSILVSAGWIGYSLQHIFENEMVSSSLLNLTADSVTEQEHVTSSDLNLSLDEKGLIDEYEAAAYLSMSVEELWANIQQDKFRKTLPSSYDSIDEPFKSIPYITVYKDKRLFSKDALDAWIFYQIQHPSED